MSQDQKLSRRHLLTVSAAASGAALIGTGSAQAKAPQVPRRVLGKTKQSIPILLLGGGMGFKAGTDPRIRLALQHGVNYVDTARKYAGGSSERNAASTLNRQKARKETWITSKTPKWSARGFEQDVAISLESMKTSWVDLYFLHGLDELGPLDDRELIRSVESLKAAKKIRFFGFSCHGGNVAELLHAAAKRPFVDAVMFKYSFRDYGDVELNRAIDAAHKAGVGLIAMKTQGSEAGFRDAWKKFEQAGKWNKYQAVLKAVWADERITAAVSHMDSVEQLRENIAAALDPSTLGALEQDAVRRYAELTRPYACRGCDHLCNPAVDAPVRIGTTLRSLMYHDSYGDSEKARRVWSELPPEARQLGGVDFTAASRVCPHGVDVVALMQRAAVVLA
ncbi:MAG TPA: aldo/keto reductase [Polyangiaceae bacterium]